MNNWIYFFAFIGAGCVASIFVMAAIIIAMSLTPPVDISNDLTDEEIGHDN